VPQFSPRLLQVLARLKFSGFVMTALLIDNAPVLPQAKLTLASQNIDLIHIQKKEDLQEIARTGL
jgi:hypothetical protein